MARGIIRKPSFNKIVGAYRSQWKRFWMRLFTFGAYGRKGMGWWRDPKKAWYNFVYHRTSISVYRLLGYKPSRVACFFAILCASAVSIVAAPIDATSAGIKAHKIKKERKARAEGTSSRSTGTQKSSSHSTASHSAVGQTSTRTHSDHKSYTTPRSTSSTKKNTTTSSSKHTSSSYSNKTTTTQKRTSTTTVKTTPKVVKTKPTSSYSYSYSSLFPKSEPAPYVPPKPEEPKEPDENTPKSKPMTEGDQYIRKRMIIAGSYYCDQSVISQLAPGTYFQVVAEPDNPHDKNAVALYYQDTKIGYIAKNDVIPFVTCLKLRRNIYGVVTDVKEKDGRKEIEYETWFAQRRKEST